MNASDGSSKTDSAPFRNDGVRPIIIGAGRGKRLGNATDAAPKCYVPVGNRRIIDWIFEAFTEAGLDRAVFVGGYLIDHIRQDYPSLQFCHNRDWENNNILASLMHAEPHMDDGFVCSYSDILFRGAVVSDALKHPGNIVLGIDRHWRDRYTDRRHHPQDDAEKVLLDGNRIVRISRDIPSAEADGEYIGVARFSDDGALRLREHYHRARESFTGRPWRGAEVFEKSYLIALFQEMLEAGVEMYMVPADGRYMEIDTEEDYRLANELWIRKFLDDR